MQGFSKRGGRWERREKVQGIDASLEKGGGDCFPGTINTVADPNIQWNVELKHENLPQVFS